MCFLSLSSVSDVKRDETPPRTPTGVARSSESDADVSSPNASQDERLAKELSIKESSHAHRPKRRRFHESYNFNMKCPTPGCNSLGTQYPFTHNTRSPSTPVHLQHLFTCNTFNTCSPSQRDCLFICQ